MAARKGSRIFVWIILGFLFVGLVGFGATGISGNIRTIGTVGSKAVSVQHYSNALTEQIRAFEAQIGQPLSFPLAQSLGLDRSVRAQVIQTRALDNEVAALGISVGDARVRDQIVQIGAFRGLDGAFSRDAYRETLRRNGLSEGEFETGLREDTARSLLQAAVLGGVPAPDAYVDALIGYIGERRSLVWAALGSDALAEPLPAPSDEDLLAHYLANPEAFTAPETRAITYAWLRPEMIQDQLPVDEEAVAALYQEGSSDYVQPERRLVERLVYLDDAAATAARARLDAGEIDFDGLVAERGLDLSAVDLGDVALADLGAAGEAVFAAVPGNVLGPLPSALGPALFRMNAILGAEEITFEEAAPDLRGELAAARARRVIEDQSETMIDLIAGGASLEDLAANTDLELGRIDWQVGQSDGIAAYETFREAAAAVQAGATLQLTPLSDGGVFALRLDALVPPTLRPIEEVGDDLRAGWTRSATQAAIMAQAEALRAQIAEGAEPATLGLTALSEVNLTRRDFVNGTPPSFMTEVFTMAEGETRVIAGDGSALIVRLDAIAPPDPTDPAIVAQRAMLAEQVASGIGQDVYGIFARDILDRTEIKINEAAVAAVHAQFQ